MPVDYLTLRERWPRFASRLSSALRQEGAALRRQDARLEIDMGVYTRDESGYGLNAGITLKHAGVREASIAALHITDLPAHPDEKSVRTVAHQANDAALAWLRGERQARGLPVFFYPPQDKAE